MKQISGDIRRFLIINTTDYNSDGSYSVIVCDVNELPEYGVKLDDSNCLLSCAGRFITVEDMGVGDVVVGESGAYIMRIA